MRLLWAAVLLLAACDDGGPNTAQEQPNDSAADQILNDAALEDQSIDATPDAAIDAFVYEDAAAGPPPMAGDSPRFRYPIHQEDRPKMVHTPVFGVDHDPAEGERAVCSDFTGRTFPNCYDGHRGSDFLLKGSFPAMDRGSARIVAAAGGEVIEIADGNYDRCHADAQTGGVSCDGNPMQANFVKLRHFGGWNTWYYHMKTDSVAVEVGQRVRCGEFLGIVGSSGISALPHLHFQVMTPAGEAMDPFAGAFSQTESLWVAQGPVDTQPGDLCDASWIVLEDP